MNAPLVKVCRHCNDSRNPIEWSPNTNQWLDVKTKQRHDCKAYVPRNDQSMQSTIERIDKAVIEISKQNKDIIFLLNQRTKSD